MLTSIIVTQNIHSNNNILGFFEKKNISATRYKATNCLKKLKSFFELLPNILQIEKKTQLYFKSYIIKIEHSNSLLRLKPY